MRFEWYESTLRGLHDFHASEIRESCPGHFRGSSWIMKRWAPQERTLATTRWSTFSASNKKLDE